MGETEASVHPLRSSLLATSSLNEAFETLKRLLVIIRKRDKLWHNHLPVLQYADVREVWRKARGRHRWSRLYPLCPVTSGTVHDFDTPLEREKIGSLVFQESLFSFLSDP